MSLSLCRHAGLRGHAAWLVHAEPGDMVAAYQRAGAQAVKLPARPIAIRRVADTWRSYRALAHFTREHRIDVLVTSQVNYVSLVALVARTTGARSGVHLGLVYDYPSPIFRTGMRAIDLGIVPSERTADGWRRRGWPQRSLRTIANGVDTTLFTDGDRGAARQRIACDPDGLLVAYVGRLVPEKGIGTLLRAFARYASSGGAGHLLFVGNAPAGQEHGLDGIARDSGLQADRWSVRSATPTPEDVYRAADLVVVPSECHEAFGLVPVEAMLCRTMTIVSDRDAFPSFVAPVGESAVFPAGDAKALAERLTCWSRDAGRRESAAALLQQHAREHYGFEACGDAYLAAFESVVR
jgi:glycosyltransferase involved in cell wall biosynthesis